VVPAAARMASSVCPTTGGTCEGTAFGRVTTTDEAVRNGADHSDQAGVRGERVLLQLDQRSGTTQ
jgi:hypothetical protein